MREMAIAPIQLRNEKEKSNEHDIKESKRFEDWNSMHYSSLYHVHNETLK